MLLTTKNDSHPVLIGQVIPTFFGKMGVVLGVWKPSKKNPAGCVQVHDGHGDMIRHLPPVELNLEFAGR